MIKLAYLPHITSNATRDFVRELMRKAKQNDVHWEQLITEEVEAFGFKGETLKRFLKGEPIDVAGVPTLHIPDLEIVQSADRDTLKVEEAFAVYDILINYAGARPRLSDAVSFVCALSSGECPEYRFQGDFGFGGKFRNGNTDTYYIDYYLEHRTDALDDQEARTNAALAKVAIHYKHPERFADRSLEAERGLLNELEQCLQFNTDFPAHAPLDYLTMTWLVNAAGCPDGWNRMFSKWYTFDQTGLREELMSLVKLAQTRAQPWERPIPKWERESA